MRISTTTFVLAATLRVRFAALMMLASIAMPIQFATSTSAAAIDLTYVAFSETFDTDAANLAAVEAAYPLMSGLGTVSVSGGQVGMVRTGNSDHSFLLTDQVFNEEIWVTGEIGQTSTNAGSTAPALVVGNRAFEFFPGNGSFRIYEFNTITGAFTTFLTGPSNIPMGFAPPVGLVHSVEVHSDNLGNFDVMITNSSNPANVYMNSFFFPGFVPGGVGFSENHNTGTYIFDNLQVVAIVPVPEPASLLLLGLGALGMVRHTRRHKRRA